MRKIISVLICVTTLLSGCETKYVEPEEHISAYRDEITIMHIEAGNESFLEYISEAEECLQMKINVVPSSTNADNRQALISTLLSSGDTSIDLIAVNDEMTSEFKYKGYLEPLDDIMTKDILKMYPTDYVETIAMADEHIYSVPYLLDFMMFWVNEEYLKRAGLEKIQDFQDFQILLQESYEEGSYGYGSAWEETYIYNDLSQFINMLGGDYYDWSNTETRKALQFLQDMVKNEQTPRSQMIDQYEQMEQKFIDGRYGSIFMYSGAMNIFYYSGKYGEDQIHAAEFPIFGKGMTNIATWQYVLNKASGHKDAAKRFLAYVASEEGCIAYSNYMKQLPARLDVLLEEDIDVPDLNIMRSYVEQLEFKARPFSEQPMEDITEMGRLLQKYLMEEISIEEFCKEAQRIIDAD